MPLIHLTKLFFTYTIMCWHFGAIPSYTILDLPDALLTYIYDLLYYQQMAQFTPSYNPEDPQEYQLFLLHYYCFIIRSESKNFSQQLKHANKKLYRLYSAKTKKQFENTNFDPRILYKYCKKNNLGINPTHSEAVCYTKYTGCTYKKTHFVPFILPQITTRDAHFNIKYYLRANADWLIYCTIKSNSSLSFAFRRLSDKNALPFLIEYIGEDTVLESIYPYLSHDNKDINQKVRFEYTFNSTKQSLHLLDNPRLEKLATIDIFFCIPIIKEVPANIVYNIFHKLNDRNIPIKTNF